MKKRFISGIFAVALLVAGVAGCCKAVDPVTGKVTKSFFNCTKAAQNIVCNPSQKVLNGIAAWQNAADTLIGMFMPGSAGALIIQNARMGLTQIQTQACAELTLVNETIRMIVDVVPQVNGAKAMTPELKSSFKPGLKAVKIVVPPATPIQDWVKNEGKVPYGG